MKRAVRGIGGAASLATGQYIHALSGTAPATVWFLALSAVGAVLIGAAVWPRRKPRP